MRNQWMSLAQFCLGLVCGILLTTAILMVLIMTNSDVRGVDGGRWMVNSLKYIGPELDEGWEPFGYNEKANVVYVKRKITPGEENGQ